MELDVISIAMQVFRQTWYLILIVVVVGILKTPRIKGALGEFQVNVFLKLFLSKKTYHLIKDVTLPTSDGTTQIDHVVVSKYGIFVIETKNMKGWIYGSAKQRQWTKRIYKSSYKFQNPLHQNYKHIKTLEKALSITPGYIFSLIIFVGNVTFKSKVPSNVTHSSTCIKFIKSKKTEVLTQQQVRQAIKIIQSGRLQPSFKTNREHVAHLKARHKT